MCCHGCQALLRVSTAVLGIELGGHRTSFFPPFNYTHWMHYILMACLYVVFPKCRHLLLNPGVIVADGRWLGGEGKDIIAIHLVPYNPTAALCMVLSGALMELKPSCCHISLFSP